MNQVIEHNGHYHCDLDITKEQWLDLLKDDEIVGYAKETLLKIYYSPEHKNTCKGITDDGSPQSANSIIMNFGKRVGKKLNMTIIGTNGKQKYWPFPMKEGVDLPNGLFEWTLRDELVEAIKELWDNNKFTWIPFYNELAEKLLEYKEKRSELIGIIHSLDTIGEYYKNRISDIDPYSVFSLIDRFPKNIDDRNNVAKSIKEKFGIKTEIPSDYDGVPRWNNLFFYKEDGQDKIQILWNLFVAQMNNDEDKINQYFNEVISFRKRHITLGLFWVKPNTFMTFDIKCMEYLKRNEINVNFNDYDDYKKILVQINDKIKNGDIIEKSFPEISYNARNEKKDTITEESHATQQYWWLVANPNHWSFSNIQVGEDEDFSLYNEEGNKRRIFQNFTTAKCGDIVLGYETGNIHKIVAILEVSKENDGKTIHFKKIEDLATPIDFSIVECPYGLENMEYVKSKQGTFYKLTVDEYNIIMDLIRAKNPEIPKNDNKGEREMYRKLLYNKKNLILQGAPGTGKTYNTATLALSICGVKNGDIFNVNENGKDIPYTMDFSNHSVVMKRYEQLHYDNKNNPDGQIAFCTFHQSMDYEDFIEGIKPKTENGIISYNVEDGIFKILSTNANKITTEKKSSKIDFKKTRIFKMSLGKKGKDDEEIFSYCFENNVVALGWGENKDFSDCRTQKDFIAKYVNDSINKWGAVAMEIFKQQMKKGDIILVSNGTKAVKAIAKVVGEYEFHDDAPIDMCQFRKVEWLYTGEPIPITKLYNKNLSQQSIYAFYDSAKEGKIDFNSIKTNILNDIITGEINNETPQNYVLIIDEINRGNVSKIFGELITLLEADKRLGGEHPIKVTLPYSKDEFGVPSNLYIIGTMNTTDRSVGNIDYAVRRRFAFVTLKSKREIVENKWGTDDCKAVRLFDAVKSFIEKNKYDMDIEDLMVGHSYFMANDDSELELKWQYEILPLLNEYIKDGILKGDPIKSDMAISEYIKEWNKSADNNE